MMDIWHVCFIHLLDMPLLSQRHPGGLREGTLPSRRQAAAPESQFPGAAHGGRADVTEVSNFKSAIKFLSYGVKRRPSEEPLEPPGGPPPLTVDHWVLNSRKLSFSITNKIMEALYRKPCRPVLDPTGYQALHHGLHRNILGIAALGFGFIPQPKRIISAASAQMSRSSLAFASLIDF